MIKTKVRHMLFPILLCSSVIAMAQNWGGWETSVDDNQISWRSKNMGRNPYSGACDWALQIQNNHNYTADIRYGFNGTGGNVTYDHTALYQAPGAVNSVTVSVSNCSTLYFGAAGKPSTN